MDAICHTAFGSAQNQTCGKRHPLSQQMVILKSANDKTEVEVKALINLEKES